MEMDVYYFSEPPTSYEPIWCNGPLACGEESITEHLLSENHNLTMAEIESLDTDMRYRLHDTIHNDPEHPLYSRMDEIQQKIGRLSDFERWLLSMGLIEIE